MVAEETLTLLRLFGGFSITRGGQTLSRFRSKKVATLLAYLASPPGRSHRREMLTELFWPEMDPNLSANSFRVTLNWARTALRTLGLPAEQCLVADRSQVQLDASRFITDVAQFETLVRQANSPADKDDSEDRLDCLERAAAMYLGPFLEGYDEDWIVADRQRLEDIYAGVLKRLILEKTRRHEYDQALGFARRSLSLDPLREETHRDIMQIYLALGRPAAAKRQYLDLERLLKTELGAVPSASVRSLLQQIEGAERERGTREGNPTPLVSSGQESGRGNALPSPPTRFFGREEDLEAIGEILVEKQVRLLTVTGAGGTGKTRLVIEAVQPVQGGFPGGTLFVPLDSVTEAEQIPGRLAAMLSEKLPPNRDPVEALVDALQTRESTLIILDNLEHLLEEEKTTTIIRALLQGVPNLSLLVTSRQRLALSFEREYPLLPLATPSPRPQAKHEDLNFLLEFPGVRLFVDRVRLVRPSFTLTRQNATAVAELCYQLDGLPLAIELAAAWARTLTIPQMLSRLTQRLDLFASTTRDTPERHRTMRSTVNWSYRLLSPDLQRFFRSLSVFTGGWTVEAAEAVAEEPQAITYLHELQTRSLVIGEEQGSGMRFRLLETLREFGWQQLTAEERVTLRRHHATYFNEWISGNLLESVKRDTPAWLDVRETEYPNLRSALEWCLTDDASAAVGLTLGYELFFYWILRGSQVEGQRYLQALLALPVAKSNGLLKARLLMAEGYIAFVQGDFEEALRLTEGSLPIARESEDNLLLMNCLSILGNIMTSLKGTAAARSILEECLAVGRRFNDPARLRNPLIQLGEVAFDASNYEEAGRYFGEALAVARATNSDIYSALALDGVGRVCCRIGEYKRALSYQEEALQKMQQTGNWDGFAIVQSTHGETLARVGRFDEAERVIRECLTFLLKVGRKPNICCCLRTLALLYRDRNAALSVRLLAAGDGFEGQYPNGAKSWEEPTLRLSLQEALGDALFQQQYDMGQTVTLESAAREALDFGGTGP